MFPVLTIIGLLIIPSVCYAHSGAIINTVSNYAPFIIPFLSSLIYSCRKFFKRLYSWITQKTN